MDTVRGTVGLMDQIVHDVDQPRSVLPADLAFTDFVRREALKFVHVAQVVSQTFGRSEAVWKKTDLTQLAQICCQTWQALRDFAYAVSKDDRNDKGLTNLNVSTDGIDMGHQVQHDVLKDIYRRDVGFVAMILPQLLPLSQEAKKLLRVTDQVVVCPHDRIEMLQPQMMPLLKGNVLGSEPVQITCLMALYKLYDALGQSAAKRL